MSPFLSYIILMRILRFIMESRSYWLKDHEFGANGGFVLNFYGQIRTDRPFVLRTLS